MEDLINAAVSVAAANPKTATAIAAVPAVQAVAFALRSVLGWLGTARGKGPALPTLYKWAGTVAAFPLRLPAGR